MNEGKAKHYHHAVDWLRKARQAALLSGRAGEWTAYLDEIIDRHRRKYSLVPQLEQLR